MSVQKVSRTSRGVGLRLVLAFALLIVAMIGVAWLGIVEPAGEQSTIKEVHRAVVGERTGREVLTYSNINIRLAMEVFATENGHDVAPLVSRHAENTRKIEALLDKMHAAAATPEERTLVENTRERSAAYLRAYENALSMLLDKRKPSQARALMIETLMPAITGYHDDLDRYIAFKRQRIEQIRAAHDNAAAAARRRTVLSIVLVVATAAALALFVGINIALQVRHRRRAEEALTKAHHELEDRIRDRTSELLAANEQLQHEVAARHSIQIELQASEHRYRRIVESAEDMIYRLTPDGRVTFVNSAAAKLVRRSAESCRGTHFLSFTRKDFRPQALKFYSQQIDEKIPLTYLELPLAMADGSEVWVGQNVQLIMEDGEVVEVQAVSRDVTERKNIERQLLDSEQRYRMLFAGNPQPMWVFDAETLAFLEVNDAALSQYGYSRDEFLRMTLEDVRPAEDVPALLHEIEQNRQSIGSQTPVAWRHKRKDGTLIDVEVNWHSLEFAGRPAKLVLLTDVTERRRAEAAVRSSDQRYRDIVTFAPIGIYQSSVDGSILTANQTLASMLGYGSVDELLKLDLERDVYLPGERNALIEAFRATGDTKEVELQWRKKDGAIAWVELTAHCIQRADGTEYFEGFVHDITSRKQMEEQRQVISEIIQGVITTSDLNELLSLVHRSISKCLYAENCFVTLLDEETQSMSFPFWVDKIDPCPEPRPLGRGFSSYVVKTGQPLCVGRQEADEMCRRGEVENSGSASASWLGVPLRTPSQVIGALIVQHYSQEDVYDERDLEFLSSVGSQMALAIERRRGEQALQESEDRYHRLVELSPDGIIIHQDGRIVFVNSAGVSLVGATDESQLLGQSVYNLALPEYRHLLAERVERMSVGDTVPLVEVRGRRFDGPEIHCEVSSVPFTYRDRFATLAVVRDITERKHAEQALNEANERALKDYERLVERIAVLGQSLANERDLQKILRALRDFAEQSLPCDGLVISLYDKEKETRRAAYCWVDREELEPGDIKDIPVGEGMVGQAIKTSSVLFENDFQQFLQNRKAIPVGEFEGNQVPRSALVAPMTVFGRTIGCVEVQSYKPDAYQPDHGTAMRMAASVAASAIENVTLAEREQEKEEQLRQAQKMEAVGRLAGGVAHDFNNLLTAITGYSELTLRELDGPSRVRSRLEEIKKAGERAASLTRQLLAFSRKQMLQPRVLDLNTIISDMDKMLRRLIGEDILLQTSPAVRLGQVKADPGQVEQILMNLVVNARDALPLGGHITIETRNVHLDRTYYKGQETLRAGHYIVLSVSDDGCGMDAETQAKIFEPFFTTKEFGKGTGLGLSTVYGIVKQSEGSIWVYSELGKGTTFRIYLPRVDDGTEDETAVDTKQPGGGKETILLVEDEQMVRDLSREVLEQYGYSVLCAADGAEGLQACREFSGDIDLVITDVVMPRMSGRELAENVAILRPQTRVLYMSGFTDDAIVRHGLLEEDIAFIQKPFSPVALASKARELLDAR